MSQAMSHAPYTPRLIRLGPVNAPRKGRAPRLIWPLSGLEGITAQPGPYERQGRAFGRLCAMPGDNLGRVSLRVGDKAACEGGKGRLKRRAARAGSEQLGGQRASLIYAAAAAAVAGRAVGRFVQHGRPACW